jgi:hypothetical protein
VGGGEVAVGRARGGRAIRAIGERRRWRNLAMSGQRSGGGRAQRG